MHGGGEVTDAQCGGSVGGSGRRGRCGDMHTVMAPCEGETAEQNAADAREDALSCTALSVLEAPRSFSRHDRNRE